MRIKASYTVENSYIIPLFTIIIVTLMAICFFAYDSVVINSGLWQAAMKTETMADESEDSVILKDIEKRCTDYIIQKSIFVKEASVSIKRENNKTVADANVDSGLVGISRKLIYSGKTTSVKDNNPARFIRVVNAVKEVVKKDG